MTTSAERIAADLEALADVPHRFAGSEGERRMLHAVRERLDDPKAARIEGFVAHTAPAVSVGLHAALMFLAGLVGFWWPAPAAVLCAVVLVSLIGEGTGHFALLRSGMPKSASYNLVVRRPHAQPLGAVVIAAPLDAPRWRPDWPHWVAWRRPLQAVFAAALIVTFVLLLRALAEPWGPRTLQIYWAALLVLGGTVGLGAVVHRRVWRGSWDASGITALLELLRRLDAEPVPGVQVHVVWTGCGRAFQGGMDAFLALHGRTLPDPVLVVALDDPGRVPLAAAVSEGPLWSQHHRPTGPALVERLRWAGVMVPPVDLPRPTDARAALVRGVRGLGLVGGEGPSSVEGTVQACDVVETLVRWYGEDLARVAHKRPALEDLARSTRRDAEEEQARRRRRGRGAEPAEPTEPTEPAEAAEPSGEDDAADDTPDVPGRAPVG